MKAALIMERLLDAGIRVALVDGRIRYRAPIGAMTDDLRREIAAVRGELIELLAPTGEEGRPVTLGLMDAVTTWPNPTCSTCESRDTAVFVEMTPGPDGIRWWLCGRCWS